MSECAMRVEGKAPPPRLWRWTHVCRHAALVSLETIGASGVHTLDTPEVGMKCAARFFRRSMLLWPAKNVGVTACVAHEEGDPRRTGIAERIIETDRNQTAGMTQLTAGMPPRSKRFVTLDDMDEVVTADAIERPCGKQIAIS
jgi:hypothetical protein